MTPTLYLTRNGLLEPLGQSQVIAYLRGLSRNHKITLITYEKPEDWADSDRMADAWADCEAHGIRWLPQQFRQRPKIIAPALSMARMVWLVRREVRRGGIRLIHARSYIPAAVALTVSRMTRVPFLFDMRALWPEELITPSVTLVVRSFNFFFKPKGAVGVKQKCQPTALNLKTTSFVK